MRNKDLIVRDRKSHSLVQRHGGGIKYSITKTGVVAPIAPSPFNPLPRRVPGGLASQNHGPLSRKVFNVPY